MQASLFKIITDNEGESRIILLIPSSDLAQVVKLNKLFGQLLEVQIETAGDEGQKQSQGRSDL